MKVVPEYGGFGGFTIQQIEIFLAVAKHLNYSKAARELYISQPAVSSWIMRMEEAWGVKVFKRLNRGVELTPEGLELYTKLEHVYQRFRVSVNMIIREMLSAEKFDIGCQNTDIAELAKDTIDMFRQTHEDLDVYSELFNYHELREKLMCGELDVIFTAYFDVMDQPGIQAKIIGELPYYFYFAKEWETMGEKVASVLNGKTMTLEIHNGVRHSLDLCKKYDFSPCTINYLNSYLEIIRDVAEGKCFTIGGSSLAQGSHFCQKLRTLPPDGFNEPIAVAWCKDNYSPWLEKFLTLI